MRPDAAEKKKKLAAAAKANSKLASCLVEVVAVVAQVEIAVACFVKVEVVVM